VLAERRDAFVRLLGRCEGLACLVPEGTFYLFASCAGVIGRHAPDGREIRSDRDFAAYLLDSVDVAVVPGADLGVSPYVRMSFANTPRVLEEAARRIERACAALA